MEKNRTALLLIDKEIITRIKEIDSLVIESEFDSFDGLYNSEKYYDVLIISDRILKAEESLLNELMEVRKRFVESKIIYLMSNQHDIDKNSQIIRFCISQDIHIIYPGKSVKDIINELKELFITKEKEEEKGSLITFIGTSPNIGVHTLAINFAILLAKNIKENVALLDLDLKGSKFHRHIRVDDGAKGLDLVYDELKSKTLTQKILLRHMKELKEVPNLKILTGTEFRERSDQFLVDEIAHLLDITKKEFPITISVVNAYWDNAATLYAVQDGSFRYVVTVPEITSFMDDWKIWFDRILFKTNLFKPEQFDLILNQSFGTFSKKDVSKEMNVPVITEIPYYVEMRESINIGVPMLIRDPKHELRNKLMPMVRSVQKLLDLTTGEPGERKKGAFRFLIKGGAK